MFWKQKPGWYGSQLHNHIKALNDGDYSRIPWIFCVFAEPHAPSKLAAAKALSSVLRLLSYDDIVRIDQQMRQTTSMEWSIDWHKLQLQTFFTAAMSPAERHAVVVFSSFNPNGYIREQAVRMMGDEDGMLAFILLRQNDWIAQVRQAATNAFEQRLQNLTDDELLVSLPFAEKLRWSSRASHHEHIQKFFDELTSNQHRSALEKGLQSKHIRTRKLCTTALLTASHPDIDRALIQLKHEPDPFQRAVIFKKLHQMGQNMEEPAQILLHDKYSSNQMLAFRYLCDTGATDIPYIAIELLLAANFTVRTTARRFIEIHMPDFDVRAFYKDNLKQATATALYGLGETGHADDTKIMEPYLCDHHTSVVRAALVSLMRLDRKQYYNIVVDKLSDSRAGVIKAAQRLILKYGVQNFDEIYEIFRNTPYEYTKIKCMAILFSASKWDALIYMILTRSSEEERVKQLSLQRIQGWLGSYNYSYIQPNQEQKETLIALLCRPDSKIPSPIEKELRFVLK